MQPLTSFPRSCLGRVLVLAYAAAAVAAVPAPLGAQLISVKTVPVAAGNQFMIFPSDNAGLGGLSIAVHDRSLDPFVSPGKGARIRGGWLAGAPGFYHITGDNGGARTLPLSAAAAGSRWFGGGAVAFQELDVGRANGFGFGGSDSPLSASRATNVYVSAFGGARLNANGLSLGAALYWADLQGLDGVKLLYDPAATVEQSGHMFDLRLGLFQEWDDNATAEVVVVHNRFDMTHDIVETRWWWPEPEPRLDVLPPSRPDRRQELDQTNTWGVHMGYQRPVGDSGWRVGGILTGNWKSHPKIPDYDIMRIPRDPGDSWAYNVGVGLAQSAGATTFGFDLIYEPIWSDTWVEASEPVVRPDGGTIPVGGRTLENDFRFSNLVLRTGVGRQGGGWGAQFGLQVRSYSYELEQTDRVAATFREQDEAWLEWTPTWAVSVDFDDLSLQYAGNLTSGAGRPGALAPDRAAPGFESAGDFLAAPRGPLTLQDATVMTHRITVRVPMG